MSHNIYSLHTLTNRDFDYRCYLLFFKLGANLFTRFLIPRPLTGIISVKRRLVLFDVTLRRWLFPPFVRTNFPEPVRRNLFEVALWVFNLYLPVLCFRATSFTPLKQNPAEQNSSADILCKCFFCRTDKYYNLFLLCFCRSQYH